MEPTRPKISGKDYSVYNPTKARLGMRLWVEAFIQAIPKYPTQEHQQGSKPE